jgi:hypothetical protein
MRLPDAITAELADNANVAVFAVLAVSAYADPIICHAAPVQTFK